MHQVQSVAKGHGALVRDQLLSELEQELESEVRPAGPELSPATPVNTFVATSPDVATPVNTFIDGSTAGTPVNTFLSIPPDVATPVNTFLATPVNTFLSIPPDVS